MCKTESGDCGCIGATGPQGLTGPKGDTGDTGPQGSQGLTGATGSQGATGPQGNPGINGLNATMSIGTVVTGNAGTSAQVSNGGTSTNAIWNFTIPKGDTGATGAAGANGATAPNATFWHDQSIVTVGAALNSSQQASYAYAWRVFQSAGAQNDSFYQDFVITSGTYTLTVSGTQNTNCGVQTWYLDGVSIGTMDWYRASLLTTTMTLTGIVIPNSPTVHRITSTVLSKNGSSTAYNIFITKWWFG